METTKSIINLIDTDDCNKITLKLGSDNQMFIDMHMDTDDGTFPRVSDYMRRANRLEKYGTADFLNWMGNGRMKFKIDDGYSISRKDTVTSQAVIVFDRIIRVEHGTTFEYANGFLHENPCTSIVNRIRGHFVHDWVWQSNGAQDKIANGFYIYFVCEQFEYVNPYDKRKNKYFLKKK